MPTLSAIQLDQFLSETVKTTSLKNAKNLPEPSIPNLERRNTTPFHFSDRKPPPSTIYSASLAPQMSPSLYTTPEPTPIPVSPTSSFPPISPFLINHKRRGPRLVKSVSELNNVVVVVAKEENVVVDRNENEVSSVVDNGGESEDFFDPQDSISVSSFVDGEERSAMSNSVLAEFYDAWEELSCDSGQQGSQRSLSDVETELREMRLTLLMEIEKRKQVEEGLHNMQRQWQTLREMLGSAGLVLPSNLTALEDNQSDVSHVEEICRQLHVARFVSDSVGRGIARAEVEVEMEAQLEVKNFEIARLCDRLHYYETMNKEMSQINQETVEIARHDRQKRRRRQKWIWGSIATAITLGSAALAWSYFPGGEGSSSTTYLEAPEPGSDVQ